MSHDHLTYEDLLRIVELVKTSEQFAEFRLKIGDIEVELRRKGAGAPVPVAPQQQVLRSAQDDGVRRHSAQDDKPGAPQAAARSAATWPDDAIVVRAPMVGTFYRAPQPGAPPFVDVGHAVQPDTVVCIIEVMKLMSSITAGVHGTVTRVLVDDAAAVETGEPLIVLAPAPRME